MSYILDALKKAQAERQLGHAPTLHAPAPRYAEQHANQSRRWPLVIVGVLACAGIAAGIGWWLRAPVPHLPKQAPVAATPVTPVRSAPMPTVMAPTVLAQAPAPQLQPPSVVRPPPVVAIDPKGAAAPTAAPSPAPAPAPAAAPVDADDALPLLMQLAPDVRQRLPRVAFGGYLYSPDPAERLLLVDNVLRHEGEEVASGLVLERLLPKSAVMNYRGLRYRVAY